MSLSSALLDSRTIRVFISSTFQDMQDERTELIRRTFPRLREMAAQRDVTLSEVDLRWGITKDESESGKVMEICLREVENSIPFFIGIIGNRYGWVPEPKDISDIVKERFPDVPGYVERHLSATEIEMQFGVLGRTDVEMNAYFFIKDGEEATDVDNPERLAALKKAVLENKRYPVSSYSNPEDLADQVLAAFTKLLDDLFPVGDLSALEKERLGQRAVLNNLSRVYIKNEANFAVIDKWMEDWEKHQLVITGESGLGKSALVANWINEKLGLGDVLPYKIIYHFVGYGGSIGSDWHVVKALCDEIRDRYGFVAEENEPKTDEKALDELFKRVAAEGDKPLLIVLDGINQIIDVNHAKRLNWLPIPPRKVKILFTTLADDETMQVFRDRHYPVFTLQPLTRGERIEMVREYLEKTYRKHLSDTQLERIVDDPQNENTLVLKTLLDEVANFGVFDRLDEKIEEYLKPDSIGDFYQVVLKNYEADFKESPVRHFLSLIAVSRNGLSEDELLDITGTKDRPLLWSQFFCSFRQHMIVKNGLVSFAHGYIREAVEARYMNGHEDWDWVKNCREEIVTALEDQKTPQDKKTTHSMDEVPYQLDLLDDMERLHDYLLDWDVFSYLYHNEEDNLRYYWQKLIVIGDYSLEGYLTEVNRHNEDKRTSDLFKLNYFMCNAYGIWGFTHGMMGDYHMGLGYDEKAFVDYQRALEFDKKALEIFLGFFGENYPDGAEDGVALYNNAAKTYGKLGDYHQASGCDEKALADYLKSLENRENALRILENLYDENHTSIAESYSTLADTYNSIFSEYRALGDHKLALKYAEKELAVRHRICDENHPDVATSYHNVGFEYSKLDDHRKALEYEEKALIIRRIIFGENHPDVATSYNNVGYEYGELGNHKKALEYQEKAFNIYLFYFGKRHPSVAIAYSNVGFEYGELGDLEKELEYRSKALEIARDLKNESLEAAIHNRLGKTYERMGIKNKAREEYKLAADMFKAMGMEEEYTR